MGSESRHTSGSPPNSLPILSGSTFICFACLAALKISYEQRAPGLNISTLKTTALDGLYDRWPILLHEAMGLRENGQWKKLPLLGSLIVPQRYRVSARQV